LEDAQHVAEFAEAVASIWQYDKIVAVVKTLIQLVRRIQTRWPAYSSKLARAIKRARELLGLLSDLEVESRVRSLIVAGKKPPAELASRVKTLMFSSRINGDDVADLLTDLTLVAACKNLESVSFAGCPVKTVTPLLACKKLRFIDAESSLATSFKEFTQGAMPALCEIVWADTPAFAARAWPPGNRTIISAKANDQRRIVKARVGRSS
jgi:hypothetical protein